MWPWSWIISQVVAGVQAALEPDVEAITAALSAIKTTLAEMQSTLSAIQTQIAQEGQTMALDLSNLQTAVTNETTVEQSAITLMQGLTAQIQTLIANSGNTVDPAALQAIVDSMTASQQALAAAVAANTPAAPAAQLRK